MKIKSTFKNIEHTPALDERINEKSQKLVKYFDGSFDVQWTCHTEMGMHHADLKIVAPMHTYSAKGESDNLYKAFDIVINKIQRQLDRQKGKWRNKINKQNRHTPKYDELNRHLRDEQHIQDEDELRKIS